MLSQKGRKTLGTVIKCRPKLRKTNKKAIWKRIEKNKIDLVVKDLETKGAKAVVIRKRTGIIRLIEIITDLIYRLGRIAVIAAICILMTVGVNAIINPQIREILFNYLPF